MSTLSKIAEVAVTAIAAILKQLPVGQRRAVLDAAWERAEFDRKGNAKLAARKAKLKARR